MAINAGRVKSLFEAAGIDLEAHAKANGDASVEAMLERIASSGRSEESLIQSIAANYGEEAVQTLVKSMFDTRGIDVGEEGDARYERIAQEIISGGRTVDNLRGSLDRQTPNAVKKGAPSAEKTGTSGVGGNDLKILQGKKMKWYFDQSSGKWYVGYGLPNSDREMIFEADPDQLDALFGKDMRPANYEKKTLDTLTSTGRRTFAGNISEMEGTGSFEGEYQRVLSIALDSGMLPEWARQDKEVEELLFIAQAEKKSSDWLIQQISQTQGFKHRFGGSVDAMKKASNLTTVDAISGVLELEGNLKDLEKQYGRDGSRINPQLMTSLINKGVSMIEIEKSYQVFKRMEDNKESLNAFNEVLVARGGQPLTTGDMFKFLSGEAPQELYDVYEASSFRELAQKAGLGNLFSAADAIDAALESAGVLESDRIEKGFQDAAQLLLRLRHEVNVGEYGLDEQEILDVALGRMPQGRSRAEILDAVDKATSSAREYLQRQQAAPYRNYQGGRVKMGSLANARTSG